jgi:hypothetical protein
MGNAGSLVNTGSVAVDPCGSIFLFGGFGAQDGSATIDFAPGTLTAASDTLAYAFLAKISPEGIGLFAEEFSSQPDTLGASALTVDALGGPVLAVDVSGSVTFGGPTLTSSVINDGGEGSVALVGFSPSGSYRWSLIGGPPSTAVSTGMSIVGGHSVTVAGTFGTSSDTLTFGDIRLTASTNQDLFLATFSP